MAIDAFGFEGTPVNEDLMCSLQAGSFLLAQPNIVLVGGTGKTHLAIAITSRVVRAGARGRYFNIVDLVTRLDEEIATVAKIRLSAGAGEASTLQRLWGAISTHGLSFGERRWPLMADRDRHPGVLTCSLTFQLFRL